MDTQQYTVLRDSANTHGTILGKHLLHLASNPTAELTIIKIQFTNIFSTFYLVESVPSTDATQWQLFVIWIVFLELGQIMQKRDLQSNRGSIH